jgi:curved DNA-binding protein
MKTEIWFKDYYKILEIDKTASIEEIKYAFRKLAKETHPDKSNEKNNYSRFVLIREAYEILSDEILRKEYDQNWDAYHQNNDYQFNENYFNDAINDFYKDE